MKTRFERTLAAGAIALMVLLAFLVQLVEPKADPPAGSVASAAPTGRRALFLLLAETGFRVAEWHEVPGALPRGGDVLWLARPPEPWKKAEKAARKQREEAAKDLEEAEDESAPGAADLADEAPAAEAADLTPAGLDLRRMTHYRRFVEEGGRLVLGQSDDARRFLVDVLGIEACADVHVSRVAKAGVRRVRSAAGVELEVEVAEGGMLVAPEPGSPAAALWTGGIETADGDEVLVASVPVGRGEVVLLGDDGFLDNARIAERDHAILAVRLAEDLARGGRILFDEYALGLVSSRTAIDVATSPSLVLVTLHLALLAVLLAWRAAWVREFPRDPEPLESLSPLARARAQASLLERARRWDLLARMLRQGAARRLEERFRAGAELEARLGRRACASAEDLEALGRSIAAFEREIEAGSRFAPGAPDVHGRPRRRAG